jgi:hypothetical protein
MRILTVISDDMVSIKFLLPRNRARTTGGSGTSELAGEARLMEMHRIAPAGMDRP